MTSLDEHLPPGVNIDVVSEPVLPGGASSDVDTTVAVVAMPEDSSEVALVLASMRRPRRAEHEELHAQLAIDGVFADAVRAPEIELGGDPTYATFVARFVLPPEHVDGRPHRVRVSFAHSVSRIVVRGENDHEPLDGTPQGIAEADFVARALTPLEATGT